MTGSLEIYNGEVGLLSLSRLCSSPILPSLMQIMPSWLEVMSCHQKRRYTQVVCTQSIAGYDHMDLHSRTFNRSDTLSVGYHGQQMWISQCGQAIPAGISSNFPRNFPLQRNCSELLSNQVLSFRMSQQKSQAY